MIDKGYHKMKRRNFPLILGITFMFLFFVIVSLPVKALTTVFDDMEHGDPFGNGWFTFGGAVGGGGIDANTTDLPPSDGGVFSLETGWVPVVCLASLVVSAVPI